MEHNKKILILVVSILLLGAGFYFWQARAPKPPAYLENLNTARQLFKEGDTDQSLDYANKALLEAGSNKQAEAVTKLLIALIYLRKTDLAGQTKAIQLMKEIAGNAAYPNFERALALQYIADTWVWQNRSQEFVNVIFSDEPYASFLSKSTVTSGIRKIYEYSISLYPLPVAEYSVAKWNSNVLWNAINAPKGTFKLALPEKNYIDAAEEHLKKGDDALPRFMSLKKNNGAEVSRSYLLKGIALGQLAELEKKPEYNAMAEDAFKKSQDILNQSSNEHFSPIIRPWLNFYYAVFLERAYGKQRIADINNLLTYMIAKVSETNNIIAKFIARWDDSQQRLGTYEGQGASALAKINPAFKELLRSLGWKI